ncbi:unnamed protein product [Closterium sp. NIES-54]
MAVGHVAAIKWSAGTVLQAAAWGGGAERVRGVGEKGVGAERAGRKGGGKKGGKGETYAQSSRQWHGRDVQRGGVATQGEGGGRGRGEA